MPRRAKETKTTKTTVTEPSYLDRVEQEVEANQSKISLILGGLIVVVAAFLLFNYFNKDNAEVTPMATSTETTQQATPEDAKPAVAGQKYTVKAGDTLFLIAQDVYKDGYKFTEIVKANKLVNSDVITVGQVLEIPKLGDITPKALTALTSSPTPTVASSATPAIGAPVQDWGSKITTATYVVVEGDWLSTIAGRAYGDVMGYQKIAEANKITNPDLITPGMTLVIPR